MNSLKTVYNHFLATYQYSIIFTGNFINIPLFILATYQYSIILTGNLSIFHYSYWQLYQYSIILTDISGYCHDTKKIYRQVLIQWTVRLLINRMKPVIKCLHKYYLLTKVNAVLLKLNGPRPWAFSAATLNT